MLNLNNQDKCLEGAIDINNMFFKPRLYQEDCYINCNPVDLYNRYNYKDIKNNISHITSHDLEILYTNTNIAKVLDKVIFNCHTISQAGNILKIKKWIISAMFDHF